MTDVVEIEVQNEVAILRFNRADALNALIGAGDRAFCAGVDLKEARAVQLADIE